MIKSNIETTFLRVKKALEKSPYQQKVQVVGASKKQSAEKLKAYVDEGFCCFGENYIQEATEKKNLLKTDAIDWHFIGHLQSKKVKSAIGEFALIHSVDRLSLAEEISKRAVEKELQQKILLQVNIANEESKSGCSLSELESLVESAVNLPGISIEGFMTMPPLFDDLEKTRPYFTKLRELRDNFKKQYSSDRHSFAELSMGTSSDFEIAIEEGATLVRIGTLLLGERPK